MTLAPPARKPGRPRKAQGPAVEATLNRDRIVDTALALIDRDGIAGFNMRELARALGVYPAAVYWHVPSRTALLSAVVAQVLGGAGLGAGHAAHAWQDRLRAVFVGFRAALRKHPALAPVVASELTGNASFDAALLDHIVASLEDAGFAGAGLVQAYNVVIAAMCGFATLELSAPPEDETAWETACRARIAEVAADTAHPALRRHLARLSNQAFILRWSGGAEKPMERSFEAWVDVVLRGLEARAAANAAERLRRTAPPPA